MGIIINADMPRTCRGCDYAGCPHYSIPWGLELEDVEYGNYRTIRHPDCPLKSTDEMIEEIEETYIDNCDFNYRIAIDIINKYCDKEIKDDSNGIYK